MASKDSQKKKNPLQHLIAGGCAGFVESSVCHPLDTIKTRMQLRHQTSTLQAVRVRSSMSEPELRLKHFVQEPASRLQLRRHTHTLQAVRARRSMPELSLHLKHSLREPALRLRHSLAEPLAVIGKHHVHEPSLKLETLGPFGTAKWIIRREGFHSLYKGLTAVWTGIVPKMAIRFVSFEEYKQVLAKTPLGTTSYAVFLAGLCSGLTEAVMVVTPAEVCKIRMQSQYNSMIDPSQTQHRKYTNVLQTAYTIVREEGLGALYKGVVPTMMRQGCNQAVNFTAYQFFKKKVMEHQGTTELQHWQSLLLGGMSGGMGPMVNNPLDVVKTRMQKQVVVPGKTPKYTGLFQSCAVIAKEEGHLALWKGITPRLLRIMPGQAITFMTYEAVSARLYKYGVL